MAKYAKYDIPTYVIDLSLPPEQRFVQMGKDYSTHPAIERVRLLFDKVAAETGYPVWFIRGLSKVLLRRLYSEEETAELQGFSDAVGLEMFYLVAFNTFLDTFMGCTSGAANVKDDNGRTRLLHFRTLDWQMDELRQIMVKCEFVKDGGEHVATTVGYDGYVGVLTGVRRGLSISLNFRPNRNEYSFVDDVKFRWHLFLVLAGFRPSISSILRSTLFSYDGEMSPHEIAEQISHVPSTAAYITLCDGNTSVVIEKDVTTGLIQDGKDFLTVTNHDLAPSACSSPADIKAEEELRADSLERKSCISQLWKKASRKGKDGLRYVLQSNLVKWIETQPIKNDATQYAAIMDPTAGQILYLQGYNNVTIEDVKE